MPDRYYVPVIRSEGAAERSFDAAEDKSNCYTLRRNHANALANYRVRQCAPRDSKFQLTQSCVEPGHITQAVRIVTRGVNLGKCCLDTTTGNKHISFHGSSISASASPLLHRALNLLYELDLEKLEKDAVKREKRLHDEQMSSDVGDSPVKKAPRLSDNSTPPSSQTSSATSTSLATIPPMSSSPPPGSPWDSVWGTPLNKFAPGDYDGDLPYTDRFVPGGLINFTEYQEWRYLGPKGFDGAADYVANNAHSFMVEIELLFLDLDKRTRLCTIMVDTTTFRHHTLLVLNARTIMAASGIPFAWPLLRKGELLQNTWSQVDWLKPIMLPRSGDLVLRVPGAAIEPSTDLME